VIPNYSIARIKFLKDPGYPGDSNLNFLKFECTVYIEFLAQKTLLKTSIKMELELLQLFVIVAITTGIRGILYLIFKMEIFNQTLNTHTYSGI